MNTRSSISRNLASGAASAMVFLCLMLIEKFVEYFILKDAISTPILQLFGSGIAWMLTFAAVIFLLQFLIGILSPKAAWIASSTLYSALFLSELGLALYAQHNGTLLGCELWERPLQESIMAIQGSVGSVFPIVAIIVTVGLFLFVSHLTDIHFGKWTWIAIVTITVISFVLSIVDPSPTANKTIYLLRSSSNITSEQGPETIEFDPTRLEAFYETWPDFVPDDPEYPLERTDTIPSELAPYFESSKEVPNIVILIVESLGHEMMPYAPFLDSLAGRSLYWPNGLSTTPRSFGAIPAITGSVGGPKSFQFGNMPDHNSLLSILKSAGFRTNAFYAGGFSFDCIYEYLSAQHIDYLSPLYEDFKDNRFPYPNFIWGYHDEGLLDYAIDNIDNRQNPQLHLITTLSTHESLDLGDKKRNAYYEQKASALAKDKDISGQISRYAAMCYTDECLQKFVKDYLLKHGSNTIFVITGDHASGLQNDSYLAPYHVPIIIWSPLLNGYREFHSIATHNDIAPALFRLMRDRYSLPLPKSVHWLGQGLPTDSKAVCNRNLLFLEYNRDMRILLSGSHLYVAPNQMEPESLLEIDTNLYQWNAKNPDWEHWRKTLDSYRYLYLYTYNGNRLTKHPIFKSDHSKVLYSKENHKPLTCITPSEAPNDDAERCSRYFLLKRHKVRHCEKPELTVSLEADITLNDSLWVDQYMELIFNTNSGYWSGDKIVKYLNETEFHKDSTYHLSIRKTIPYHNGDRLSIRVRSPKSNDHWKPNTGLTIEWSKIKILE